MFITEEHNIRPFEKLLYLATPTPHRHEGGFYELDYIGEAFEDNWLSTEGENIRRCEELIAAKVGVRHAVGLSCGTAALHLAVKTAGEAVYGRAEPGKGALYQRHVACSDVTFDATVNPVLYEGGVPVFIDAEYDTWNMDPAALERAFERYPDIRVVVMAHLYGTPGKMAQIREIAHRHGALVVEDAAESLGASYRDTFDRETSDGETSGSWRQTGSLGDIGCISTNGNKIITGSSGGFLLTDDDRVADKVRKWATQSREDAPWYQHEEIGYNYRMSNIVAGMVRGQIPFLEEHIGQKREVWERYGEEFRDLPVSMNPIDFANSSPNYWLSCMIIRPEAMCRQVRSDSEAVYVPEHGKSCPTEILERLSGIRAQGRPIWKPMHMQPMYRTNPFVTRDENGRGTADAHKAGDVARDGRLPDVGADIFERGLCLPSDNKMTPEQQERVIEVVKGCFG